MKDPVGDAFKELEHEWRQVISTDDFVVVRVDGRAFHTYTRGLDVPFDVALMADMDVVAETLAAEITGAVCAYVQSDEISVVATAAMTDRSQHYFGGVVAKVGSMAASVATATFNGLRPGKVALFDARVFPLSSVHDVARYLRWRQDDARRNAVSMLAHHHLGKKAVHGVGTRQRIERLAGVGIDVAVVHPGFSNGRLTARETRTGSVTYSHKKSGELVTVDDVTRHVWVTRPAPIFDVELVDGMITDRTGSGRNDRETPAPEDDPGGVGDDEQVVAMTRWRGQVVATDRPSTAPDMAS